MAIVTTAKIGNKHQENLKQKFPHLEWIFCESLEQAISFGEKAEVLVTYGEDLTSESIQLFPVLQWIQVISAGVERMPLRALEQQGVIVTNARGIHRTPMAEYTLGLMLDHSRRFQAFFAQQREQLWDRSPRIDELAGKTLGILGAGAIGSEIARKAKVFDMHIMGLNQSGKVEPYFDQMYTLQGLDHMLSTSDYLVIILPLTPQTQQLIGERELRLLKSSAVLINIARGAIVDENALVKALRERWIEAAYLDVFIEEPLPSNHLFWTLDNCWITPHISGRSPHYMNRALAIFEQNLEHYMSGQKPQMINLVSAAKGY